MVKINYVYFIKKISENLNDFYFKIMEITNLEKAELTQSQLYRCSAQVYG